MSDYCGERYFPAENALSATLVGYLCTREKGHPPPHRNGPKVYCGQIYRKGDQRFYCNLDLNHRGLHGFEPPTPSVTLKRSWLQRLLWGER